MTLINAQDEKEENEPPIEKSPENKDKSDKFARKFFPILFIIFSIIYWSVYLSLSY